MGEQGEIYLDHNATTRVLPAAAQQAFSVMEELYGNPSSTHIAGLQARKILNSARDLARRAIGADQGQIIFTSGATEAIQTGIFSALCHVRDNLSQNRDSRDPIRLLYGATEHKAVPQALKHWNDVLGLNAEIVAIPVDGKGQLDESFLRQQMDHAHFLATMAVNNETGVIHDLNRIESILSETEHRVYWMVDCVQAVGKIELNLTHSRVDYAPISGHKLYAPKGIGILYVREDAPFTPLLAGGGQEGGSRGGTENLPGVAAIAAVLQAVQDRAASDFAEPAKLEYYRDRFHHSLRRAFPNVVFNSPSENTVPTTINFAVGGIAGKELLDLFDAAGIRVSSGSACGSAIQGSYVLEAMGLPQWQSDGAIRLSFGPATTDQEVDEACRRIEEAGRALAKSCLVSTTHPEDSNSRWQGGLLQLKSGSMCSWILSDPESRRCVIIDPFLELMPRIETIVRCQNLQVVAVLDTHLHVDHDSPRQTLAENLAANLIDPGGETDILGWPKRPDGTVQLGDERSAEFLALDNGWVVARTDLPGHTEDGQIFLAGPRENGRLDREQVRFAFSGDTLLIGGIGRTDFSSSAAESMLTSLRKLPLILADHSIVCPTHDYTMGFVTTLDSERRNNALLARILDPVNNLSVDEYLTLKQEVDSQIDDTANCELVCGRVQTYTDASDSSLDVAPEQLKLFFEQHRDSLIVDVREPQEFHFAQDWHSLGLQDPPVNVPLTRFGDFLSKRLTVESDQKIVFICRSGNRSAKAAQVVRRLGIASAWNILGGIALGISPSREVIEAEELEYTI